MRRRRGREPEFFLEIALGSLAAAHRFRDQRVGQHKARVGDVLDRQQQISLRFALAILVAVQPDRIAFERAERAFETLAALDAVTARSIRTNSP